MKDTMIERVQIRWMIRPDLGDVLRIEQDSFLQAWTEEDFLRALRQRYTIGMVAESGERIRGFFIYELKKTTLELLNIAVEPERRRHGIGAKMVRKLCGKLSIHRRPRLVATVRESNMTAQLFFQRLGLKAMRVRRGYYQDTGEDGYVMSYRVSP